MCTGGCALFAKRPARMRTANAWAQNWGSPGARARVVTFRLRPVRPAQARNVRFCRRPATRN
eukprot:9004510-Alexandrium_andersonii.AAC.1